MKARDFLAETINYGGLPVTRATAYALAFEATGSKRAAEVFAYLARSIEAAPMSEAEAREMME